MALDESGHIDLHYYFTDHLGSTRAVYNGYPAEVGADYSVVTYKPFGVPYQESGSEKAKFAGELQDQTGLIYLFARCYDPGTGRFISLDPRLGSLSMYNVFLLL